MIRLHYYCFKAVSSFYAAQVKVNKILIWIDHLLFLRITFFICWWILQMYSMQEEERERLLLSSSVFHITPIWRKVNVFIFCTIKIKHVLLLLLSLIMNVKRNIFFYIIFVLTKKKTFRFLSKERSLLLFFFDSSRD